MIHILLLNEVHFILNYIITTNQSKFTQIIHNPRQNPLTFKLMSTDPKEHSFKKLKFQKIRFERVWRMNRRDEKDL